MTRAAGADDLRMVNGKNGRKHVGVMAILADVARLDVRRILAGCLDAVVAINAVTRNVPVVEIRRDPTRRCVAVVAGFAARNVVRCLSGRSEAVVAGATGSGYLSMVDHVDGRKCICVVAILAYVGSCNVSWVLSGCIRSVVAARTICRDIDVVEISWNPASRRMTIVASVAAVQVSWVFARG